MGDLTVGLMPAMGADRAIIEHLWQFYIYDFTDFKTWDVDDAGRFGDPDIVKWWSTDGWHPYLIRVDGQLAGFAVVADRGYFSDKPDRHDVSEFFVLRRYRRRHVGEHVARSLFDRFPGPWDVRVLAGNERARAFWRTVIDRHTDGHYTEVSRDDEHWRGWVFSFDMPPRA